MSERNICTMQTPIGLLHIEENGSAITIVSLVETDNSVICEDNQMVNITPLLQKACKQLTEYFAGSRTCFDLPLAPAGTEFQKKVWKALRTIPYGETASYGEIARRIGNAKACRAVGGANNKNPILIMIPCHRCIGANGAMVGFGCGISVKEQLLELEKQR